MKQNNINIIFFIISIVVINRLLFLLDFENPYIEFSSECIEDSYVISLEPNSNFGGQEYLQAGKYESGNSFESFFKFDLSEIPKECENVLIVLPIYGVSQTLNLNVYIIEEEWGEYNITWVNKPDYSKNLTTVRIFENTLVKIDISEYISNYTVFSICLSWDPMANNSVVIYSREYDESGLIPQIKYYIYDPMGGFWIPALIFNGMFFILFIFWQIQEKNKNKKITVNVPSKIPHIDIPHDSVNIKREHDPENEFNETRRYRPESEIKTIKTKTKFDQRKSKKEEKKREREIKEELNQETTINSFKYSDNVPSPKKCPICGSKCFDDTKFCPICGSEIN